MAFRIKFISFAQNQVHLLKFQWFTITTRKDLKMPPKAKKAKKSDDFGDFLESINKDREGSEDTSIKTERIKILCGSEGRAARVSNAVIYWMERDQRVQDNWAFLYAQSKAKEAMVPLHVIVCLWKDPERNPEATLRHFHFQIGGLKEVEKECQELNIGFCCEATDEPSKTVLKHAKKLKSKIIVADFSPLREQKEHLSELKGLMEEDDENCLVQVDAHNVVPCWIAAEKEVIGARIIRPKIEGKLKDFLIPFPSITKHLTKPSKVSAVDWDLIWKEIKFDKSVKPVEWARPGTVEGIRMLHSFINDRLPTYSKFRNDPTKNVSSNLSPWVRFGQISAARSIMAVKKHGSSSEVKEFVEEMVVRRELSDNFCYYNENYDNLEKGCYNWAWTTLDKHRHDKRQYLYSKEELEEGKTHEDIWNAAQHQLLKDGKIHGFMRMYWAKKILEWTKSPEEALDVALYLNDHYSLDGADPNGFVGCMWSICGTHDHPWVERPIFGKIRYMNYAGCKRKFDVDSYVQQNLPQLKKTKS